MNIQIFGRSKSFDSRAAQRYFKERRIPFQLIDLNQKGLSRGELTSVLRAVGSPEALLDPKHPDAALFLHLAHPQDQFEKLLECPAMLRAPIVRNGKQATVGYCPTQWETWK